MSTKSASPNVDTNQILAAGLAATAAAFVTSRFGVAGTLIGAGITAMIITGGSAIVKAYMEYAAERARGARSRFRSRRDARPTEVRSEATPEEAPTQRQTRQDTLPERPDLRDNGVGRLRAALDWFRNLPTGRRRPILIKALLAAGVAFVICMVAVWGVEKVIGNSLSCGIWSSCPYGAAPGIHLAGFDDSGARSSLAGGRVDLGGGGGGVLDSFRNNPVIPEGARDAIPGGGESPSSASPAPGGGGEPPSSASPEPVPEDPASASPAAGGNAEREAASPAPRARNDSDASASPAP